MFQLIILVDHHNNDCIKSFHEGGCLKLQKALKDYSLIVWMNVSSSFSFLPTTFYTKNDSDCCFNTLWNKANKE